MQSGSPSNLTDTSSHHMCSMSMLWKWKTIDACFVSDQWQITDDVAFAFSIIGVFLIPFLIEGTRRIARNYDRVLALKHASALTDYSGPLRPTLQEQIVRGVLYGMQFSAGFILMLIAMSHNGFAILAIFLGGTLGYLIFGVDTLNIASVELSSDVVRAGACCT
ncbi:Copper Transporter integral membrane protein that functions in high affinity copper transport [Ceratobasidium sp. 392]|nr:Copper Transporter integral membrane protein that functions in high affinity copper transport [Ceratobasidium sp. 392]